MSERSIAFIHKDISNVGYGGVSYIYQHLAEYFSKLGWKVFVVTRRSFRPINKNIVVVNYKSHSDPFQHTKIITKIVKQINPMIAECSNWKFELLDYVLQKTKTTKVVVRCDPSALTLFGDKKLTFYESILARAADLVTAVSSFTKEDILSAYNLSKEKVKIFYNGIHSKGYLIMPSKSIISSGYVSYDSKNFRPLNKKTLISLCPPSAITVFWCGKMTTMKGFDILQKIILSSSAKFNFIINLGHSYPYVKWKIKPKKHIVFLQDLTKEDQLAIMKSSAIYLSTSRVEGFGLSVLEALALKQRVATMQVCKVFDEFPASLPMTRLPTNPKKIIKILENLAKNKPKFGKFPKSFTIQHLAEKLSETYQRLL